MHAYVEEIFELEQVCTSIKGLHTFLDAKYGKKLNKVIKNQCQPFTCNEFLNYYNFLKSCSMEQLVLGKQTQYSLN